eukprot:TRINITY_DN6117_c4_g1_i1.p1 TRINITY_DN6117_c4_g1~~TRINITY_DN6117_c4_g1_i1.p1  ORF type:complete len:354 (+),score=60.47 TRINITY_DN6117_c4_g1_i1:59-1120(+)
MTVAKLLLTCCLVLVAGLLFTYLSKSPRRKKVLFTPFIPPDDTKLNKLADEILLQELSLSDLKLDTVPIDNTNTKLITLFNNISESDPLLRGMLKLNQLRFSHIPKTGGTFIEEMFLAKLRIKVGMYNKNLVYKKDPQSMNHLRSLKCVPWHYPLVNIAELAGSTEFVWGRQWLSMPKFAIVRDPLDRLISEYNYMTAERWGMKLAISFCDTCTPKTLPHEFCNTTVVNNVISNMLRHVFDDKNYYFENCHFVPQINYLITQNGDQHVRYVMKQENLTSEIQSFMGHLGVRITPDEIKSFGGNHNYPPCRASSSQLTEATLAKIVSVYEQDYLRLGYQKPIISQFKGMDESLQ